VLAFRNFCPTRLSLQISALRIVLGVLLLILSLHGRSSPPESFAVEVADGVFVHNGVHAGLEDPRHDDIANTGFIVGAECVAIIDSGGSVAAGRRLLGAVRSRTSLPICYVINTHVHYDHVLGNAAFRDTGARFVGHAALADAIAGSRQFFLERFASELEFSPGLDPVVGPDILVDDTMRLDLGGRVLELRAHATAHTTADLSILDRRTETLWLGDLLFMQRLPALDGSLRGWLAVLAQAEALKARRVVPGHGPASAPWPGAASDQRRYLERLLADVRSAISQGQFLADVLEHAARDERQSWLLFEEVHPRNVTRAFTELEWE
jgi:quinoprotein relay system zinc metallohydrolase 2